MMGPGGLRHFALLIALCLGGMPAADARSASEQLVAREARACLAQFNPQALQPLLECMDPASVARLAERYIDARLKPAYRGVPDELRRAQDTEEDREWFLALKPSALLALAGRGILLALADRGHIVQRASLELLQTRHRIQEVYELKVRLRLKLSHGDGSRAMVRSATIRATLVDGQVTLGFPDKLAELIGIQTEP
jgi:hypothetical protein